MSPAPDTRLANQARRLTLLPAFAATIKNRTRRAWGHEPYLGATVLRSCAVASDWHSYLTHLDCTACGLTHDADVLQTVCSACGKVLFARYDLAAVRQATRPSDFSQRRWDMWRYWELLPVRDPAHVISLGEGLTPLVQVRSAAAASIGLARGQLDKR